MKMILILAASLLSGCVSSQVQKEYDSRAFTAEDKKDISVYAQDYNKLIMTGSTSLMTAVNSGNHNGAETVQQYFCACFKKLGNDCSKNSNNVSSENRSLWAKGAAAELSLKALGYPHLADKDLCK